MIVPVNLKEKSYNIYLERGAIERAKDYFNLERKVLVVTDSGVPESYAKRVAEQSKEATIVTIPQGEQSKSIKYFEELLKELTLNNFTRSDCVVAVGGGVVGDLSGFAAASYMRGIDFYNIPSTVLSQVDSSIGGKVAIDFMGYKNIVGAFYQPKGVIVDPDLLKTLPARQISNGLSEAVKMSLTSDPELFKIFEENKWEENIETVIERSLKIKRAVVEEDEKETGLRKILNFGHTLAHGIESEYEMKGLFHGECVALGMIPMCSAEVRCRLKPVLKSLKLPESFEGNIDSIIEAIRHDKKMSGDEITVIYVNKIGSYEMKTINFDKLAEDMKEALSK